VFDSDPPFGVKTNYSCALAPLTVLGPTMVTLAAGSKHTCGLTADGAAYCWGANNLGQAGPSATESCDVPNFIGANIVIACSRSPVAVSSSLRFGSIDADTDHTCGVAIPDGAVYCWGGNRYGQLGDATTTDSPSPVRVLEPEG
jgi:alpha-tubulin suppressor-like RCC1 family protein